MVKREIWPFLKVAISLKPKKSHPPKLVQMYTSSIPTCMNFLSRFRSIKIFDDHGNVFVIYSFLGYTYGPSDGRCLHVLLDDLHLPAANNRQMISSYEVTNCRHYVYCFYYYCFLYTSICASWLMIMVFIILSRSTNLSLWRMFSSLVHSQQIMEQHS